MSQVPSVGRVVHYRSYGTPNGEYTPECRAAIVTEVGGWVTIGGEDETDEWAADDGERYRELRQRFEPDACQLKVENPTGTFNNLCSFDENTKAGGTWHWPERT